MKRLNFKESYIGWVNYWKKQTSGDTQKAMEYAIGGEFEAFGEIERQLLLQSGLGEKDYLIDVGCGSGRLAKPLSPHHSGKYLGIDIVPDLVDYARKLVARPDWRFEVAAGLTIPEEDEKADMVCFFSVFTHLLHDQSYFYLQEAKRVLKPNGKIVFSFLEFTMPHHWPIFENDVKDIDGDHPLNMFMSRDAVTAWTEHLGLKIERVESGDSLCIELPTPVTTTNGTVMEGKTAFGQSVCIVSKAS